MADDDALSFLQAGSDCTLIPSWAGKNGYRCMLCGSGAESIKSVACKKCAPDWLLLCFETRQSLTEMTKTPVDKNASLLLTTKMDAVMAEMKESRAAAQLELVMISEQAGAEAREAAKQRKMEMLERYKASKGMYSVSYGNCNPLGPKLIYLYLQAVLLLPQSRLLLRKCR